LLHQTDETIGPNGRRAVTTPGNPVTGGR